ncbi:hypothetical protein TEQG_05297 [Trichophyton equinum CBS 127.97]|uniref:Uncharacterized protein n=1 Tax=Trichophyton equinum (strain ATCC MYA-4606 / CBS 127.97) TaxID=559882 RepID=F2PWM6_TRIEC|nr:hypothetical protein TEQG_05297 [Trichophyton equinum CBS 127.97]
MNNRDKQRSKQVELQLNQGSSLGGPTVISIVAVQLGRLGGCGYSAGGTNCGAAGDPQRQRRDSDRPETAAARREEDQRERPTRKTNEKDQRERPTRKTNEGPQRDLSHAWSNGTALLASVDHPQDKMDKDLGHGSPQVGFLRSPAREYCISMSGSFAFSLLCI